MRLWRNSAHEQPLARTVVFSDRPWMRPKPLPRGGDVMSYARELPVIVLRPLPPEARPSARQTE